MYGVKVNGMIRFGVICSEGFQLPWHTELYRGWSHKWWRDVNGYVDKHSRDVEGWAMEGDPRPQENYEMQKRWLTENPIPIDVENYNCATHPKWAMVIPGVGLTAPIGDPILLTTGNFSLHDIKVQIQDLKDFLETYEVAYDDNPAWLLMSFLGE